MANDVNLQLLANGRRNYVVRAYGVIDTSDIALADLIDTTAAAFQDAGQRSIDPVPYTVSILRVHYDVEDSLVINLYWDATTDKLIHSCVGRGVYHPRGYIQNNAGVGKTGKVQYSSSGWSAGAVLSYNIEVHCVKKYS